MGWHKEVIITRHVDNGATAEVTNSGRELCDIVPFVLFYVKARKVPVPHLSIGSEILSPPSDHLPTRPTTWGGTAHTAGDLIENWRTPSQ